MKTFSQRKGIKPSKTFIQLHSMDPELRNGLWSALSSHYWSLVRPNSGDIYERVYLSDNENMYALFKLLWLRYFKKPIDSLNVYWLDTYRDMKEYFFGCEWNEVYDFIEFIANNYPDKAANARFMKFCNTLLEQELSAYRFVDGLITQVTDEQEVSEIEDALQISIKKAKGHLRRSLELLTKRKNPDYRNSIIEALSAVDSICKLITKDDKAEVGQAMKEVGEKIGLNPVLQAAFVDLYSYEKDAFGIRHALTGESEISSEDARFMLTSCSSFINYLIVKSSKAGIKLSA